jgi:hypothetical protein
MLFKFGPSMSLEDMDDMRDSLDLMIISIRDGLSENPEIAVEPKNRAYAETLVIFTQRMRQYIGEMERNFNLQPRDKKTLSKSLRKSLGFEQLLRKGSDVRSVINSVRQTSSRVNQAAEDFDADDDDDDDDDDDGKFDRPANTREDDEAFGAPRAPFAGRNEDPNRSRFGDRTGLIIFGGPSYFGETDDSRADAAQDQFPTYTAPLSMSGADPNTVQVPRANPDVLAEATEDQIKQVLQPLGATGNEDSEELSAFITTKYPDPSIFVREVAGGLEEKGFSKAQIAEGMQQTELDVFADYIAENTGDTAPAPAAPARSSGANPYGGIAPPIYRDMDDDGMADVLPSAALADEPAAPPAPKQTRKLIL